MASVELELADEGEGEEGEEEDVSTFSVSTSYVIRLCYLCVYVIHLFEL